MGDWEYLIFSSYTTLFGNYYVKRPIGEALWQIPHNHRLDSRAFYAAKTAGHDRERYLFGWNPTKEENIFGFWPDKLKAQEKDKKAQEKAKKKAEMAKRFPSSLWKALRFLLHHQFEFSPANAS